MDDGGREAINQSIRHMRCFGFPYWAFQYGHIIIIIIIITYCCTWLHARAGLNA